MRFAIVGNAANPITNFRGPLIAEIAGKGHKVFALAPDFTDDVRARLRSLGAEPVDYPLSRAGLNPLADFFDAQTLRGVLKGLKLDAVLCFGIKPSIYGTLAARSAGIERRYALITGLGYAFTDVGRRSLKRQAIGEVARLLYRRALGYAERVFMQNPDDADDFVRFAIVPRSKIVTVNGTGVDLEEWQVAPPVLRPVTFLLAGRMLKDKGVHEFVEAARTLKAIHRSARFVLVGGLDVNPEALDERLLNSWVDEGTVEWPGHVDIRLWLKQTSVFVLPSYREGVPRSTQEAMALARPVVTTDVPGCRETVIEKENGFLVPPRAPRELAHAMERFIHNPHLIVEMGRKSRTLAEDRFDVRKINARMVEAMGLDVAPCS